MGPISVETEIDAPRERVFDFVSDFSLRPAWMGSLAGDLRLERIEPRGLGAGARFKPGAPGLEYTDSTIVESDRPEKIVESGLGGSLNRVSVNTVWELIPDPGGVTRVRVTFWTVQPSFFGRLREFGRSGWWRRHWRDALKGLKAAVESGSATIERVGVAGEDRVPGAA